MQRRRLGRTGVQVPVVGLGTWKTFDVSTELEEEQRKLVVDAALEAGADFVDSSPMYGQAERVLGLALEGRRDEVFVATKVWTRDGQADAETQIADALRYFGGTVDLYQVHNLSETEKVLSRLERLRDEGKTRFVGVTHYVESAFPDIIAWMRSGRLDTIQVPYNALRTSVTEEIIPLAQELDLGVIVMVPLGTGSLVKLPVTREEIQQFANFGCTTWSQVLLKWILSDTRVHVVIPATSHPEHMTDNAKAGEGPLFDEEHRSLVQEIIRRYS